MYNMCVKLRNLYVNSNTCIYIDRSDVDKLTMCFDQIVVLCTLGHQGFAQPCRECDGNAISLASAMCSCFGMCPRTPCLVSRVVSQFAKIHAKC